MASQLALLVPKGRPEQSTTYVVLIPGDIVLMFHLTIQGKAILLEHLE